MIKGTGFAFVWKETLILVAMTLFFMILTPGNSKSDLGREEMRKLWFLLKKEFRQIKRNPFLYGLSLLFPSCR